MKKEAKKMQVIENGVLKKFTDKPKKPQLVRLDNSVTKIGEYAFSGCENIMEVVLPVALEEISDRAFANSCIQEILIPDGIKRIGTEAFAGCKRLQYIEIPYSVTEIDEAAFYECTSLKRIAFKTKVIDNAYVFESQINKINACVFANCRALDRIEIPENVEIIGEQAFFGCSSLQSVVIPDRVTEVSDEAFACCRNLTKIVFSKNISEMGNGVLRDCPELENIILSCNISSVPKEMFARCLSLKNVIIGKGESNTVKRVEDDAFVHCEKLENIIFPEALEYVGSFAFGLCKKLTHTPILQSNAEIDNCAFIGCDALNYVTENTDVNDKVNRKQVYQFMLHAADSFKKDTDILESLFCWGGYSMKFVADRANYGIYSIYGCDDEGEKQSKCPIFTGSAEEIVKYLNDKENIDNVIQSMCEIL